MNAAILALVLIGGILSNCSSSASSIYAQTLASMKKRTSGAGSLDVTLQASSNPIVKNRQTNFTVTFDQRTSNALQRHIDYDLTITRDGKQVFVASALADDWPLHAAEGIVRTHYVFQQSGNYLVNVTVYGILFNPTIPESALFPINVF